MKPPPRSLPPAASRKWHSRRVWDALGYFRVRTLANPSWKRDVGRVIRMLEFDGARQPGGPRDLVETATAAAHRYEHARQQPDESEEAFVSRRETHWDEMLAAIDDFLELRQADHLRAVDKAARSGRT